MALEELRGVFFLNPVIFSVFPTGSLFLNAKTDILSGDQTAEGVHLEFIITTQAYTLQSSRKKKGA